MPNSRKVIRRNESSQIPRRIELRRNLTPAEAKLWTFLKNSQVEGSKFRRQYGVGWTILDFYCPAARLAIELDGQVHEGPLAQANDAERTRFLSECGIEVMRFENRLVFEHPEWLIEQVRAALRRRQG